ncbi:hypothetical protein [Halosimplex sp. TS25]|uniref:hypothetical protein n=1 Tax=Halosimplex rarum TaxID=3396619 RepID=UPI0039ED8A06
MTDYSYNYDKPDALLTGYTTVRGAELKEIYRVLNSQGAVPKSALIERFGRPLSDDTTVEADHVDECLKFLKAVDIIEVDAQNVVSLFNEGVYPDIQSFEARLLHHIRQQTENQYHLSFIFDVMADLDARRIPEEALLEAVKGDDETFDLTWRGEKIRMWANLAETIGAISYDNEDDENAIITSPTRPLLHELLQWHNQHGDDPKRFARALEWIDDAFLPVFDDRPGVPSVTAGVADTIRNLEADGVVSLRAMSDTQDVVELSRTQGGTENVATFEVESAPDRPTYWYPLDRNERRFEA